MVSVFVSSMYCPPNIPITSVLDTCACMSIIIRASFHISTLKGALKYNIIGDIYNIKQELLEDICPTIPPVIISNGKNYVQPNIIIDTIDMSGIAAVRQKL